MESFFQISKSFFELVTILAVANLLAHNNISQICYCGQISLQSAAVFLIIRQLWGVTFILLAMVHFLGAPLIAVPALNLANWLELS